MTKQAALFIIVATPAVVVSGLRATRLVKRFGRTLLVAYAFLLLLIGGVHCFGDNLLKLLGVTGESRLSPTGMGGPRR